MTDQITFQEHTSIHDSGTKFYRIITLTHGDCCTTVVNWGRVENMGSGMFELRGQPDTLVRHKGVSKIHNSIGSKIKAEKLRKGYTLWKSHETEFSIQEYAELPHPSWVEEQLSKGMHDSLFKELGLELGALKKVPIRAFEPTMKSNEHWGTW